MSVRARVIGGLVSLGFLSVGWQLGAIEPLNPATTSTDDVNVGTY